MVNDRILEIEQATIKRRYYLDMKRRIEDMVKSINMMEYGEKFTLSVSKNDAPEQNSNNIGTNELYKHIAVKTMMAKEMTPRREVWEQLGFVFSDIPGDEVLCYATLPKGWNIKATNPVVTEIIDENGMIRGQIFYTATENARSATMYLKCRYEIYSRHVEDDYSGIEVVFGNANEELFVARLTHLSNDLEYERIRLIDKVQCWANENYPGWENVDAYWGNNRQASQEPSRNN
ncbi:MAG: hypothetical protein K2J20_00790 [Bacilli bacterium]|nr:hypothetical protein [Bacilli bacterium]